MREGPPPAEAGEEPVPSADGSTSAPLPAMLPPESPGSLGDAGRDEVPQRAERVPAGARETDRCASRRGTVPAREAGVSRRVDS
eukprot:791184-Pyramimonas_sp.AAC.1